MGKGIALTPLPVRPGAEAMRRAELCDHRLERSDVLRNDVGARLWAEPRAWRSVIGIVLAGVATVASPAANPDTAIPETRLLSEFADRGRENALLPDFSFSGYHYSEVAFPAEMGGTLEVEEFGAVADDGESDRDAIQAAFDEAKRRGGSSIAFKKGVYLLNTEGGDELPLRLECGNVRLVGAGSGAGGTILRMQRALEATDPKRMHSTPFVMNIEPVDTEERTLAKVVGSAPRGGFELAVDSSAGIAAGDWVTLFLEDSAAVAPYFGDRKVAKEWTRLRERGLRVTERHQVVSVTENRLQLREPLQVEVDARCNWQLRDYPALEEIGIERIRFEGGWNEPFVHHRSARDDGAWSCLRMKNVRNAWMRDLAFDGWNYAVRMDNCSATTLLRLTLTGAPGHFSVHTRGGYGNLIGLVEDQTGAYHGPSVGYQSASTVFWRFDWSPQSSFDAHSTGPYATLLDACSGGWTYGRSGGPLAGMPNHLRYLTLWNFERTGGSESLFDFWRPDPNMRDRFLEPIVVGFHGIETKFETSSLGWSESIGQAVSPESLFEAQLAMRLGAMPEFLLKEKALQEAERP